MPVWGQTGGVRAGLVRGATRRWLVAAPVANGDFTARNREEGEREIEVKAVL